ncbi:MAG TPA: hypothetical protein VIY48_07410 [Candidatus Paceibacterota bacterium]
MKWAHLPNAGGLYEQDPDLLDGFEIIFQERSDYERAEREREDRKNRHNQRRVPSPSRHR